MCVFYIAQKNICLQFLIRLGAMSWKDIHNVNLPRYFDVDILGDINLSQIVYWDQTHRKCAIGSAALCKRVVSFPRNKEGKVDIKEGTHFNSSDFVMKVKYPKELRL